MEYHFIIMHPRHYLYISPDGNLVFFQYILVAHPVIPDQYPHHNQSPHNKYLRHFFYCIHFTHIRFLTFVQFVVGGPLLPNQHQVK